MNSINTKLNIIVLILSILTLSTASLFAQTVRGVVTDADSNEPLPGVNILIQGSTIGTSTNLDGEFELDLPDLNVTLAVTYIGYENLFVDVGGQTELDIQLTSDTQLLDDIVVVGYGTQKRENLTGAVTQISSDLLENRTVPNLSRALQGTIPNLNVVIGSGRPGTSGTLNIRGNTTITGGGEPLVVIDGIPSTTEDIDRLNVNDVESVTVLKDASASAIYGGRAAFGVILVETKELKREGVNFNYSNNFSWATDAVNTDFITSGYDHLTLNEIFDYTALGRRWSRFSEEDYNELRIRRDDKTEHPDRPWAVVKQDEQGRDIYRYYGNFDWHDYFYHDIRPQSTHNLSVTGDTQQINYYLSASMDDEDGIFKQQRDSYKRYNFRSKISSDVTPWLNITNTTSYFSSNYSYFGREGGNFHGDDTRGVLYGAGRYSLNIDPNYFLSPVFVPRNPDGTFTYLSQNAVYPIGYGAHIALSDENLVGSDKDSQFRTTVESRINILENLSITGNFTYNITNIDNSYRQTRLEYSYFPNVIETVPWFEWDQDYLREDVSKGQNYILNIYGNYIENYGRHSLGLTAGYNQELSKYKRIFAEGRDLLSETLNDLNLASGEVITRGGQSDWALRGMFYRVNYNYGEKYLFETSGRYDGTSRFAPGDRFGFFPSVSMGWRISEENFFQPLKGIINELKVRASYGTLGNQQVSNYAYISSMNVAQLDYVKDGRLIDGISSAPNAISSDLTWEKTISQNIGVEFGFFENRLLLEMDAYIRDTEGMLVPGPSLPSVFGTSTPRQNAGDLKTKGFEINLNWRNDLQLAGKPLSYSIGFNLSDYTGKITRYNNPEGILSDYYEGMKLGEIWGFVFDGFFGTDQEAQAYADIVNQDRLNSRRVNSPIPEVNPLQAGDIKIVDLNGDGVIDFGDNTVDNPGDRRIIGNSQPRYSFGVPISMQWNGFDIYTLFQGVGKQHWYPHPEAIHFWGGYSRVYSTFIPKNFEDKIWTPENPDAYFPRPIGYSAPPGQNNMYLQDIAYIKLRNLTIGYNIPLELINRIGLNQARVYVSGENLFTWTKLDTNYLDPEQVLTDPTGRSYPMSKMYSIGVEINF